MCDSRKITVTVKKTTDLKIGAKDKCGVSVYDVLFSNVHCFDLGEVTFKNNYTAFLSMKVKLRDGNNKDSSWQTCIRNYQLMPNPHCETGSQDYFTITRKHMLFEPDRVSAVRLVLQQPSPVWNQFTVDDVCLIPHNIKEEASVSSVTTWLLEHQETTESKLTRANRQGGPPVDEITAGLQHLWALTERMKGEQTNTSLGRYDVDGSYEINLLSYT
ncbi:nicolin-1-like [Amphiura filiformis]|uniref:nicolin-1-like n=1 Tax=Amphiura filiformis TaxID=82378 RepID=UPI003B211A16